MHFLQSKMPWPVWIDGEDIVVRCITATCFGGAFDKGDNGKTESGVLNDGRDPALMGCALPIRSTEEATRNSPFANPDKPHIPWDSAVKVWREADGEETAIEVRLIDNGPDISRFPAHALDLTECAAMHFAPHIPRNRIANEFEVSGLSFRVIGGARFI
jgi:hypothetical protein